MAPHNKWRDDEPRNSGDYRNPGSASRGSQNQYQQGQNNQGRSNYGSQGGGQFSSSGDDFGAQNEYTQGFEGGGDSQRGGSQSKYQRNYSQSENQGGYGSRYGGQSSSGDQGGFSQSGDYASNRGMGGSFDGAYTNMSNNIGGGMSGMGGGYGSSSSYGPGSSSGAGYYGSRSGSYGSGQGNHGSGQGNYNNGSSQHDDRGWLERAGDEVSSWFGGNDQASRRGRGPKSYKRSDERIQEEINDRLTDDWMLDAGEITVEVEGGEVTLSGTVETRNDKRRAEDLADGISGVKHVQNNLRISAQSGTDTSSSGLSSAGSGNNNNRTSSRKSA